MHEQSDILSPLASRPQIQQVGRLLAPHKLLIGSIILCLVAAACLGILPPYLTAQIIDHTLMQHDVPLLVQLSLLLICIALFNGFLSVVQIYLNNMVSQCIAADLREQLYHHLLDVSLPFYQKTKLGHLISRFNNDITGIQSFVIGTFVGTIANVVTLLITLCFMFTYNWLLAIVAIIIIPLFAVPLRRVGKKSYTISALLQEKLAELGAILVETLSIHAILLIKCFTNQKDAFQRFQQKNQELMRVQIRQALIGRWFFMFTGLFSTIGPVFTYLIGGLEMVHLLPGQMTIGEIVAFVALFTRLYLPTNQLMNSWVDWQRSLVLLARIFQIMEEPVEPQNLGKTQLPPLCGHILFDQVQFGYEPGKHVLQELSFEVLPGQCVALVGPSGSGKTTIVHLLSRLYEVKEGMISVDGYPLGDVQLASLREQIGMVPQETYLFHTTVRENIAYGRLGATEHEIIAAAKAAYIHETIMNLPHQYDTIVGERGYKLSGGEKQRITLARVILKNPRILILDEATSSLDSHSEQLIQKALEPLMRQRTSVVIAHRLSTILNADNILVIDHGRVVEQGTHSQLLAHGGLYAMLYKDQFEVGLASEGITPERV